MTSAKDFAMELCKRYHIHPDNLKSIDNDGINIRFTYEDGTYVEMPVHIGNRPYRRIRMGIEESKN